jgi:2-keto-4-pentenoate hydratase
MLAVIYAYRLLGRTSNISAWNAFLMPLGALVFVVALIRSALVTLKRGGVIWRGTFYPLAELRKNAAPLF